MRRLFLLAGLSLLLTSYAWSTSFDSTTIADAIPNCMSGTKVLENNNEQVLIWKSNTANQFLARAHVAGPITRLFADKNGHNHFEIQLGTGTDETLEVIYNKSFGTLPKLHLGMEVEACGDYITSTAQAGSYPPSPDGAIIHWIHRNPSGHGHDSGYLAIDGTLYGQGNGISRNSDPSSP
ncbi:DUF3465 domain-containing protein [Bdellovibrionota bacterium FG-2]